MTSIRIGKATVNLDNHSSIFPRRCGKGYELNIYMMNGICLKEEGLTKDAVLERYRYVAGMAKTLERDINEVCMEIE